MLTDLQWAIREGREGNLVIFVVDASGSMAARQKMSAVSGATLSLLRDAYQRRDKVAVITFRGQDAAMLLAPTGSTHIAVAGCSGSIPAARLPWRRVCWPRVTWWHASVDVTRTGALWWWCSPTGVLPVVGTLGAHTSRFGPAACRTGRLRGDRL